MPMDALIHMGFWRLFACFAFVMMGMTAILGVFAVSRSHGRKRSQTGHFVYSKPWSSRAFPVMVILFMVCTVFFLSSLPSRDFSSTSLEILMKGFFLFLLLLIMPLLFFMAGPEDARFDLERGTYETVSSTFGSLFPRRQSGTLDEIRGISAWTTAGSLNLVKLRWKDAARSGVTLGQCADFSETRQMAHEVAETLGLSLLEDNAGRDSGPPKGFF